MLFKGRDNVKTTSRGLLGDQGECRRSWKLAGGCFMCCFLVVWCLA